MCGHTCMLYVMYIVLVHVHRYRYVTMFNPMIVIQYSGTVCVYQLPVPQTANSQTVKQQTANRKLQYMYIHVAIHTSYVERDSSCVIYLFIVYYVYKLCMYTFIFFLYSFYQAQRAYILLDFLL
jgi:hypothetical protein